MEEIYQLKIRKFSNIEGEFLEFDRSEPCIYPDRRHYCYIHQPKQKPEKVERMKNIVSQLNSLLAEAREIYKEEDKVRYDKYIRESFDPVI